MSAEPLAAVLDRLLPGGCGFPSAGAIGLAEWIRARSDFWPGVAAALACLPRDFAHRTEPVQMSLLRTLEQREAAHFERLMVAAYSGYYVHPAVLAVVAAQTGYIAGPPQPGGYDLPPFDSAMLDGVRSRGHAYRQG